MTPCGQDAVHCTGVQVLRRSAASCATQRCERPLYRGCVIENAANRFRVGTPSKSSTAQDVDWLALSHVRWGGRVTAITREPWASGSSRLCRAILRLQEAHAAGAESARGQEQRVREHATRQDPLAAGLSRPP